jgi:hypothetical protein
MIITLDDVACLLDIPIIGRLVVEADIEYENGIQLLQTELSFTVEEAQKEVIKQWGGYVSIPHLKECYERLLNRCNQLEQLVDDEERKEQGLARNACIKVFLLLLVGYTIFTNKNKCVHLIRLTSFQDLDTLDEWSWGRMTLAFLYSRLSLTSNAKISVVGCYMTLLEVIFFFLFFSG